MSIDYIELAKRSLSNAWNYRFLWLFGVFVGAGDFFGFFNNAFKEDSETLRHLGIDRSFSDFPEIGIALIIALLMLGLLVAIIMLVMGVISEAALIFGIKRKELGQEVTFGECWSTGISKFLRVLGIFIISVVVGITSFIIFLILVIPVFLESVAAGIVMVVIALPFLILIMFVIEAVLAWAMRLAVYDDISFADSLSGGLTMFRENIGPTILVGLSSIACQIGFFIVAFMAFFIIAIPFIILGLVVPYVAIGMGVIIGLVAMILISAFTGVFKSSIWTIAYMHLKGKYDAEGISSPIAPRTATNPNQT